MSTFDLTDDFDKRIATLRAAAPSGVSHEGTLDAAVYVRDTLQLALAAARSIDAKATLDHALAIYDRIEDERASQTEDDE